MRTQSFPSVQKALCHLACLAEHESYKDSTHGGVTIPSTSGGCILKWKLPGTAFYPLKLGENSQKSHKYRKE